MLMRRMGRGDLTAHGFRATFKTWASERTAFQNEIVEASLAHTIGGKVEQAYSAATCSRNGAGSCSNGQCIVQQRLRSTRSSRSGGSRNKSNPRMSGMPRKRRPAAARQPAALGQSRPFASQK